MFPNGSIVIVSVTPTTQATSTTRAIIWCLHHMLPLLVYTISLVYCRCQLCFWLKAIQQT